MRLSRVLALSLPLLTLSGCGYVHFGRLPKASVSDATLQRAYTDLTVEQKVLKQELILAHKETDALRAALERAGSSPQTATPEIARQLEETTRELATLRASYAKLRAERTGPAAPATSVADAKLAETEQQLAAVKQDYEQLQNETAKLRRELSSAREDNAALARQLTNSVAEAQEAQATVGQLNTELASQKRARERAEQATIALRAQLEAVMARAERAESARTAAPTLAPTEAAAAPEITGSTTPAAQPSGGSALTALQGAKAPASGAVPTVELRTSAERIRAAAAAAGSTTPITIESMPTGTSSTTTEPASAEGPKTTNATDAATIHTTPTTTANLSASPEPSAAPVARTYTVQRGDTLEKIATRFYGAADQWNKIYAANAEALATSQGLKPGMELQIPEK